MKISHHLNYRLLTGVVLVALSLAFQASAQQETVTIIRVKGNARFSTDKKVWQPAKKGASLPAGSMIQTAENSTLDVRLGGAASAEATAGVVRLEPNSVMGIDRLDAGGADVGLDLRAGEINGRAGQLPADAHFEIKFSNGIVGVRSGDYHMTASGVVDVHSGQTVVVFINADGTPVSKVVNADQEFNPTSGMVIVMPKSSTEDLPSTKSQSRSESGTYAPIPASPNPARGEGMGGALRRF